MKTRPRRTSAPILLALAAGFLLSGPGTRLFASDQASETGSTHADEDSDVSGGQPAPDGLTNGEEAKAGTDPKNPDSDGDKVIDGKDGWARDKNLFPPRLPDVKYVLLDLDALGIVKIDEYAYSSALGVNDAGQILYREVEGYKIWDGEKSVPLPGIIQSTVNDHFGEHSVDWTGLSATNGVYDQQYANSGPSNDSTVAGNARGYNVGATWNLTKGLSAPVPNVIYFRMSRDGGVIGDKSQGSIANNISKRYFSGGMISQNGEFTVVGNTIIETNDYNVDPAVRSYSTGKLTQLQDANKNAAVVGSYVVYHSGGPERLVRPFIQDSVSGIQDLPATALSNPSESDGAVACSLNNLIPPWVVGNNQIVSNYVARWSSPKIWTKVENAWKEIPLTVYDSASKTDKPLTEQVATVNDRCEILGYFGLVRNGQIVDWSAVNAKYHVEKYIPYGTYDNFTLTHNGMVLTSAARLADNKAVSALLIPCDIVPDLNHDGKIDSKDQGKITKDNPFHIWINNDNDSGDTGGDDIPGAASPNYADESVNGVRDLVDFFPISLEMKQLVETLPNDTYTYELRSSDGALNAIIPTMGSIAVQINEDNSRAYLTDKTKAGLLANPLTKVVHLTSGSNPQAKLSDEFLDNIKNDGSAVILVEGRTETAPGSTSDLEVHVLKGSDEVCKITFPMKLSSVEKMFRHENLMGAGGGSGGQATQLAEPANYPDKFCNGKKFVFVHGYNVSAEQAKGWNAEVFKRLYWSGSRAKFYGVTWNGADTQRDIAGNKVTPDYHVNVRHALATGPALGSFITSLGSDVTVAAHSLGNMVVASAIQDGGASPANTFMVDAAVALECFDGGSPKEAAMMHPDWSNYETRVWASEWYLNPAFAAGDGRKKLTWRDRFNNVGGGVYNFYASSEDVERKHEGNPGLFSLYQTAWYGGRYTWALQEKLKGLRTTEPATGLFVGSTYGGWAITNIYDDSTPPAPPHPHTPSATEAAGMSNLALTTMPVFDPGYSLNYTTKVPHANAPSWIANLTDSTNGSATAQANLPQLLAEMIPARTLPAGSNSVPSFGAGANFNMPALFITDPSVWPRPDSFNGVREWRHSDVREIAYPYLYKLFDKFKEVGELDK